MNIRRSSARELMRRLLADQRVRFLLVGGVNTLVGYGVYALLFLFAGGSIGYLACLYLSYAIGVSVAFVLHRRFTFRVAGSGRVGIDFLRFASVYIVALVINTLALPLLVEAGHVNPLVSQALALVVTTLLSYFGHRFYSFRRAKHVG
jgi:putative flippase GtrA